ncbi:MAG: lipase family protein [Myxococcales bacterium]
MSSCPCDAVVILEKTMDESITPENGAGIHTRTAKAPPQNRTRSFGTTPPRITELRTVGPTAGYDPKIAYLTSVISGWSYSDAETMGRQLAFYGLPECTVRQFNVVNRAMLIVASAYYVRSRDGKIGVLAFRGTVPEDVMNWLTDANTSLRNFSFGKVHAGFFANLQPLWGELMEELDNSLTRQGDRAPIENLYITGHSLGAAMAVIAAARLCSNDYETFQPMLRGVYTFGQPAAGDSAFGAHCESRFKLYRHVYRADVVPHLPPQSVGPYSHFGYEFLATEDGWQNVSPAMGKLAGVLTGAALSAAFDFVTRRITFLRHFRFPYSMDDHGPEGYISTSRNSLG